MALEADMKVTDDISLVRMKRIRQHTPRACRQIERIVMPLECGKALVSAEPFVARRSFGRIDFDPADLGRRRAKYPGAERVREQLAAEAMADDGHVALDRLAKKRS